MDAIPQEDPLIAVNRAPRFPQEDPLRQNLGAGFRTETAPVRDLAPACSDLLHELLHDRRVLCRPGRFLSSIDAPA